MRKLRTFELNRLSPEQYKEKDKKPVIVVLDQVRSGNNVGSIFRTSDALFVKSLFLCGITAVPPSKDIHKTALDAEKIVHWEYFAQTEDAVARLRADSYKIYAIEQVEGSISLHDFQPVENEKIALIFGNEVKGVQQKIIDMCDRCIEIPQFGAKHSFNVSVSAGIVLWDITCKLM